MGDKDPIPGAFTSLWRFPELTRSEWHKLVLRRGRRAAAFVMAGLGLILLFHLLQALGANFGYSWRSFFGCLALEALSLGVFGITTWALKLIESHGPPRTIGE